MKSHIFFYDTKEAHFLIHFQFLHPFLFVVYSNVKIYVSFIFIFNRFKMGIGDWGLGIGDWGLGIGPNPQSPIPNPQFINNLLKIYFKSIKNKNK
jgi:hypothetical protein